jgi:hypothetical protein
MLWVVTSPNGSVLVSIVGVLLAVLTLVLGTRPRLAASITVGAGLTTVAVATVFLVAYEAAPTDDSPEHCLRSSSFAHELAGTLGLLGVTFAAVTLGSAAVATTRREHVARSITLGLIAVSGGLLSLFLNVVIALCGA